MKKLDEVYHKNFFDSLKSRAWRAEVLCPPIMQRLRPLSVVDVGCGTGDLLRWFKDRGLRILGIESNDACHPSLLIPPSDVHLADLRFPFLLEDKFDLAICVCVGEHIEPACEDTFIWNMVNLSNRILFAASPLCVSPYRHHNCKTVDSWIASFAQHGFVPAPHATIAIQEDLAPYRHRPIIKMVSDNLVVLRRET